MLEWMGDISQFDWRVKLIATLLTVILMILIRKTVIHFAARKYDEPRILYNWREITTYLLYFIGTIVIFNIWIERFEHIGTILGIVSAGLAIALKDPIVNLAAWAFLIFRQPLRVGDRVQIGEFKGDVIDIRLFQFTLNEIGNWVDADQSTGRIIHIPNGKIFTEMQANYSRGFRFIWNEIAVLITFESDWKKAKRILTEVVNENTKELSTQAERRLKETAKRFMIFYTKLTPIVYTNVKESGVNLTVRYLCNPRDRRTSEQAIWEHVLDKFAEHDDIDFAYPTIRYYHMQNEQTPPVIGTEGIK